MKRQEETIEGLDDSAEQSARRERLIARFEERKKIGPFMGPIEREIEQVGLCVAPKEAKIVKWHERYQ